MLLKDTVNHFSTELFYDAFDYNIKFKGKINPFAEVANSGASSQRRILETTIDVTIPLARIIEAPGGAKYIVAALNPDYWNGGVIRYKYPLLPVGVMGSVGTVGETLSDTQPDNAVYSYPYFVRREINEDERSDYLSGYELYFSQVKSFVTADILMLGSHYFRFKTDTWIDGAGFAIAQAIKLEAPIQVFDIQTGMDDYDPANDVYTGTPITDVTCFIEPLNQNYRFVTPSFTDIAEGDKAISVLKSDAALVINDRIGDYRVQSIRDYGTWVTCQCRRLS